jgi:hypothetical protein
MRKRGWNMASAFGFMDLLILETRGSHFARPLSGHRAADRDAKNISNSLEYA